MVKSGTELLDVDLGIYPRSSLLGQGAKLIVADFSFSEGTLTFILGSLRSSTRGAYHGLW